MKQLTPLSPAQFQILLALVDEERHGYGIMQEVTERSDGKVRLGPGTLYGNIKKMVAAGMIEESKKSVAPEEDRRRRYYRLTEQGRKVATDEARRLAQAVRDAQLKNLIPRSV